MIDRVTTERPLARLPSQEDRMAVRENGGRREDGQSLPASRSARAIVRMASRTALAPSSTCLASAASSRARSGGRPCVRSRWRHRMLPRIGLLRQPRTGHLRKAVIPRGLQHGQCTRNALPTDFLHSALALAD